MSGLLTSELLRKAQRAAQANAAMMARLSAAMEERYGCTHSDADCDDLVEALDYGNGSCPTLAECDALMAGAGFPPLSKAKEGQHHG